jgi:DNA-binding MarR family transcriptional regulator
MHPRKTKRRRTSKLQHRILDFFRQHPSAQMSDLRKALNVPPRRTTKLYDSMAVLIERGMLKRQRRTEIKVVEGDYEYRTPTMREALETCWHQSYDEFSEHFADLYPELVDPVRAAIAELPTGVQLVIHYDLKTSGSRAPTHSTESHSASRPAEPAADSTQG